MVDDLVCPRCGRNCKVPPGFAGPWLNCFECHTVLRNDSVSLPEPTSPAKIHSSIPIPLICPACGRGVESVWLFCPYCEEKLKETPNGPTLAPFKKEYTSWGSRLLLIWGGFLLVWFLSLAGWGFYKGEREGLYGLLSCLYGIVLVVLVTGYMEAKRSRRPLSLGNLLVASIQAFGAAVATILAGVFLILVPALLALGFVAYASR